MALVVQTMPPTAGANSYGTTQGFKDWCTSKLKDITGRTDPMIEAALMSATEYLDARFTYLGYRVAAYQELEFPRYDIVDDRGDVFQGIPASVVKATYAYAFRALSSSLWPDPAASDDSGRDVKRKSSKVGPIEEEVEYADRAGYTMPTYPEADNLLRRVRVGASLAGFSVLNTARG